MPKEKEYSKRMLGENEYVIGVSSGIFGVVKKREILGIAKKVLWPAPAGVNHTQIDLETIAEFKDPHLDEQLKRAKKLGITFGMHGECQAITGIDTMPLASGLEDDYIRAHDRLIIHIKEAGRIGCLYLTIHSSESHPLILLWREFQPAKLVDIWGRPMPEFFEEHKDLLEWALNDKEILKICKWHVKRIEDYEDYFNRKFVNQYQREPDENETKKIKDDAKEDMKKDFLTYIVSNDTTYGIERIAYFVIAKWMQQTRDKLWEQIVGNFSDDNFADMEYMKKWVPAVAAKYTWGHFNPEKCSSKIKSEDPKPLLEKYKMYFCFEAPMAQKGYELYVRMARLTHTYYMIRAIGSPWMGLTMDMEHMLSCNIDPKKDIANLPYGAGKYLKVVHVTVPTALNPSHMPVPVGSEAHQYIYERFFELRKKGFMNGWWNFERGGEEGQVKDTVLAMRLIKNSLIKDIKPKDLPEEFYGMPTGGPEITRQKVAIREHFMDPLKGMLSVPEEDYGLLSVKAREKGKLEEWKKEKYK